MGKNLNNYIINLDCPYENKIQKSKNIFISSEFNETLIDALEKKYSEYLQEKDEIYYIDNKRKRKETMKDFVVDKKSTKYYCYYLDKFFS